MDKKKIILNIISLFVVIIISLVIYFGLGNNLSVFAQGSKTYNDEDPIIKVEPESHDFLDIIKGTIVESSFVVWNNGNSNLEILSVTTSCGCTKAWIDSEIIEPGNSTLLHVSFDPNAHNSVGELKRTVYIKSNDPVKSELEIPIYVNVLE